MSSNAPSLPFEPPRTTGQAGSPALASLLADPFTSNADADVRFAKLSALLAASGDRRGPFATLYSLTTTNVIKAIDSGHFQDGAWVSRYLSAFAELYRRAFYGFETGATLAVSPSWKIAFETAAKRSELVIQDLALGVNAHVVGDLSHALVNATIGGARETELRAMRYADHRAVNDVLHAELTQSVSRIAELYAPGLGMLPEPAATLLEGLFFRVLVAGRESAWRHAVALVDGGAISREAATAEMLVEQTVFAEAILAPELRPELMAALRRIEA